MKTKIGIISWDAVRYGRKSHELNYLFSLGLERAGAIPVVYPVLNNHRLIDAFLDFVDGLVMIGGEDVTPFHYGEEPIRELGTIHFERDATEINAIKGAFKRKLPMLAVCRGLQLANVVKGGTLYQDIYTQLEDVLVHSPKIEDFQENFHTIKFEEDSLLYEFYGKSAVVNTFHHQAIKDLADGFKVVARSEDGIIEAVETTDNHMFMGIQFHPEFLHHSELNQGLFNYFVKKVEDEISK